MLPLSRSQIERRGIRLVDRLPAPDDADLDLLRELLIAYRAILDQTVDLVADRLDVEATARIKNRGTILEKLQRQGGSWLKSMHDIAGMRIVRPFERRDQDDFVKRIVALFSTGQRPPQVVDRRAQPSYGYRAVHVIVFPSRVPVEIQVRTRWQHEWAEVFEKLADKVGRGIRYGRPPDNLLPDRMRGAPPDLRREFLDAQFGWHTTTVRIAMVIAGLIAEYESIDTADPQRRELLDVIETELPDLRASLDEL